MVYTLYFLYSAHTVLSCINLKLYNYTLCILWHINLRGLFNAKAILGEEQMWCYLTKGTSGGVMVSKFIKQTYTSEFESHWTPYSFGLVLHRSKKLCQLISDTQQGSGGVYTFPKGISAEVNVIPRLELELTYPNFAVQYVTHYAMGTSPNER